MTVQGSAGVRGVAACVGHLASQRGARVRVGGDALEQGAAGRRQTISRRCSWPQGRRTCGMRLLELRLGFVEESEQEAVAVAEPAKERALSHAGRFGDLPHRHILGSLFVDQLCGRFQ